MRGTPNSVLASSEMTRLALSSPVAAIDHVAGVEARPPRARTSSQASASSHSAPGTRLGLDRMRVPVDQQDLVTVLDQLAGDRAADVAGAGDGDAHRQSPFGAAAEDRLDRRPGVVVGAPRRRAGRRPGTRSPRSGRCPSPSRARKATRAPAWPLIWSMVRPTQAAVDVHLGRRGPCRTGRATRGSAPAGQQPAQHLVGGPPHGGDGRDAEPLVDLGPAGVVDPGDDVVDAERLAGHPRGEDVGVVAAGDRGEGVGLARSRPRRRISRSKPTPVTVPPVKLGPEPAEGVGLLVDDGDRVAGFSRLRARVDPTRPQPMITTCTPESSGPVTRVPHRIAGAPPTLIGPCA